MRHAIIALAVSLALAAPLQAETAPEYGASAPAALPAATLTAMPTTTAPLPVPVTPDADANTSDIGAQSAMMPAAPAPVVLVPAPVVIPRSVVARIDLSSQRMEVVVDGVPRHSWPVSTARRGYRTPVGSYRPQRMYRRYFSRKYDNAPMPYSIFFHGGYAIHGTNDIRRLGRPASHGCVRLHPGNAATLFALVREYGAANTRIIVTR